MGNADIVIGIPSYNNEKTISFVVRQLDEGLGKHFPGKRALIVDSDGKSADNTKAAFEGTETEAEKLFVHYKNPIPGKGSAIKEIFEIAVERNALAIAMVDSDLRSINADWVKLLLDPIVHGADLVTPYYVRYRYDATITNHICYPITYGLLGRNLRQPIGGDFAFSKKAAEFYLKQDVWNSDVAKFGIDIFMTAHALLNKFEVKQAFLGTKIHDVKEPVYLKDMFREVVGTLFGIVNKDPKKWVDMELVEDIEVTGDIMEARPEAFDVSKEKMLDNFLEGKKFFGDEWRKVLSDDNYSKVMAMEKPAIGEALWCKIVYDFIAAKKVLPLIPLWSARNYTFVGETENLTDSEVEERIVGQAKLFFRERNYLAKKMGPNDE